MVDWRVVLVCHSVRIMEIIVATTSELVEHSNPLKLICINLLLSFSNVTELQITTHLFVVVVAQSDLLFSCDSKA